MRYIVTGAAGLIGSAVVWALNRAGETDILAVDHLGTSEKWKNLRALKIADYMEKDEFLKFIQDDHMEGDLEGFVHMGACSSTTETDASYLASNNFLYTKNALHFALRNSARFVYASSAATYGMGEYGYKDDDDGIEKLRPLNMYGFSKQMFDLWAKNTGVLSKVAGLKFTNVFGPNELHKGPMRSVVRRAFEEISESGKMRLFKSTSPEYPDGGQKRDFIYVKDAVAMLMYILDHRGVNGLFNIGSGRAETWNSLVEAVFAAMDRKPVIEYFDMPDTLKDKYQNYTCADMTKLAAAGCDVTARPLTDTVADCVKNYFIPHKFLGDEE